MPDGASKQTDEPVSADAFAAAMAPLGPLEAQPHLAVAVSGGPDSLALALLADDCARARGGRITALTVDHGLRPGSSQETDTVGDWLSARAIAHQVLRWTGPKPSRGRQAAARAARYALMTDWCRANAVIHLLLAHHLDDQAETVLFRLGRGSGAHGLAAMAPVAERPDVRLLRPLLGVPRSRLAATLEAAGQAWLEDPSNLDPAYTRSRLRRFARQIERDGLDIAALGRAAAERGVERVRSESAVAALLAAAARIAPAGYCVLDAPVLATARRETARRALSRIITAVSGRPYPPRGARLDRVAEELFGEGLAGARTLGGCRLVPRRRGIVVCREPAAAREVAEVSGAGAVLWDGRFTLRLSGRPPAGRARVSIARLGRSGWAALAAEAPELRGTPIPPPARPALPALRIGGQIVGVPHLDYRRGDACMAVESLAFTPSMPLAGPRFGVV